MKVTPLDIRRREFKRSVRGYLDEEVDVFLDAVADEVERITTINSDLEKKVQSLEEQVAGHTHIREALEKTLVAAQVQSEEMRSNAEKESQSMLREAEAKAKTVVDDLYAQAQSVQQNLMRLKLLEEDFRFKFKGMLEGYMELVEEGSVLSSSPKGAESVSRSAGSEPQGDSPSSSDAESDPVVDEDPTSEATGDKEDKVGAGPAAAAVPPAPLPPSLPQTKGAEPVSVGTDEDATIEVGSLPGERQGSVYFGRPEEDLDDPFPEIGGDPAKPRDFAW